MEGRIRDLYSDEIYQAALAAYQIPPGEVQALGGFESFIYAFRRGELEGILRVTHNLRRTPDMVRGELDWIQHLYQGGAGVCRPIPTQQGSLVEVLPDGARGSFIAAAFEQAPGAPHQGPDWPDSLLWEYGWQIGRMHSLSTTYQPADPDWKRPNWDDPVHQGVIQFIPEADEVIRERYWENTARIRALPREAGAYGLIHQDPHQGNFFVDEQGKITFFDFDDSSYSWFVEDIALVLFYAVMEQEDQAGFTARFLAGFLPGYFAAYPLDLKWFREIPTFLKMRELDLYAVIHRSFDVDNLTDPWCIRYLTGRKARLVQRTPYLAFDFDAFDYQQYR